MAKKTGRGHSAGAEESCGRTEQGQGQGQGRRMREAKAGHRRWCAKAERRFFKALDETGNVRAAAGAAGFSAGTVYGLRRARADFAERWAATLAGRRAERKRSIVRRTKYGAQRVRCLTQWSEEVEELFLDLLAASCNVTLACEEAGVGHTSVYRQRRTRADFAAKWQGALEQGYARLEVELVRTAIDSLADAPFDGERPIPKMSAETALKVLQAHRAAVKSVGKAGGWQAPHRNVEHYRASILRKIEAIRNARPPGEAPQSKRRGAGGRAAP